jgi:20S proteasome alpha/beta subunit
MALTPFLSDLHLFSRARASNTLSELSSSGACTECAHGFDRQPIVTGASVLAVKYKDGIMMAADNLG